MPESPLSSEIPDVTTGIGSSGGASSGPLRDGDKSDASSPEATNCPTERSKLPRNQKRSSQRQLTSSSGASRYRAIAELGRGGWGCVVEAHDEQLDRSVAVKQISGDFANRDAACQRFLHEARVTGQLQHPGIVPVHELGVAADGNPFYVMKLLEGVNFKETIAQCHRTPSSLPGGYSIELLERFVDVCHAIAFAHERNIIHRDLKPANIMVGRFGETIVVDWGLAKDIGIEPTEATVGPSTPDAPATTGGEAAQESASSTPFEMESRRTLENRMPARSSRQRSTSQRGSAGSQTRHGAVLGTPAYMSPEQSRGEIDQLTPATDIYSLGVILYEVLTGTNPFRAKDVDTTLSRVQAGEYIPPAL